MRKFVSGIVLTLLLTSFVTFSFETRPTKAATIVVPDDYSSIQEAINAAAPGDRIIVRNGTYHEWVSVNKAVSLSTEFTHGAIIDGLNTKTTIFTVTANNVSIDGFTIMNSGWGDISSNDAAIKLDHAKGCSIRNNKFTHNTNAIWLEWSNTSLISGNMILNAYVYGIMLSVMSSYQMPAVLQNNTVIGNEIRSTRNGIGISRSSNNMIHHNVINGSSNYGIYLTGGIYQPTSFNKLFSNNVTNNAYGFCIHESNNNFFYHNNVVDNPTQVYVYTSANTWDDGYPSGGNYWSDYTTRYPGAKERDSSGIWDTPYVIDASNIDRFPLMNPYTESVPWDITGPTMWVPDGKCDVRDLALAASLYGSIKGDGRYDQRADITGPTYLVPDGKIDIRDLALIAKHFGETYH